MNILSKEGSQLLLERWNTTRLDKGIGRMQELIKIPDVFTYMRVE